MFLAATLALCSAPVVVDGDTIRCSAVGRVRMVAIDTPDKTSARICRLHIGDHTCDTQASDAAKAELVRFIAGRRVTYRPISYDSRNKRVVAQMFAGRNDLQCHMLLTRHARYQARYDLRHVIRNRCPRTVRAALR